MTNFVELKKRLFASLPAYSIFDVPAETAALKIAEEINLPPYEPRFFELFLKDFAGLVERCVQYRREAMEFEILAVKAFADYELFKANSPIEQRLEKTLLHPEASQAERDGFAEAAGSLSTAGHALASGLSAEVKARSVSAEKQLLAIEAASGLIDEKYSNRARYQDEYAQRHSEPNNAHNYAERMKRAIRLLAEDIAEAIAKANAIARGLKAIYGIDAPAPGPANGLVLDELVLWGRKIVRLIEAQSQREVEYDLIIPFAQPWRGKKTTALIDNEKLQGIIDSQDTVKKIRIDLKDVFFNQRYLRLRAVALSFGNRSSSLTNGIRNSDFALNYILRATIFMPADSDGKRGPPIIIGNVPNFVHLKDTRRELSYPCFNVNPVGQWDFFIEAAAASDNGEETRIENGWFHAQVIRDLKLHLRVVGQFDGPPASAFS